MNTLKILIVEDDNSVRMNMQKTLLEQSFPDATIQTVKAEDLPDYKERLKHTVEMLAVKARPDPLVIPTLINPLLHPQTGPVYDPGRHKKKRK